MITLNDLRTGEQARVTWIMGDSAQLICRYFGLRPNSVLRMIRNTGKDDLIVAHGPRRFVFDPESAYWIKMELV